MNIRRAPVILAIAFIAAAPFALFGQGGAAKGSPAPKTAKPAATQAAAPAAQPPAPAATTTTAAAAAASEQAKCKDGSTYTGASRKGACSSHGGVAQWLTAAKGSVPKGATARCNDGTFYAKAERQGACSGHKGVAEWLKKS